MNWKTRVLAVAAAAIVVAGCGSKGSDQNQPAASQSTSKPAAKEEKSDIQVTFETVSAPSPTEAKELKGAGATFPVPLYKAWNNAYKNTIGVSVVYEGVGSGSGIKAIIAREVDIAGSDAPMNQQQLQDAKGGDVVHIPTAFGAIVPTYYIPGNSRKVKFTGDNLAKIFLGEITQWNDARLVADNPYLKGVNQKIVVVHRKDGSGSTYGLTDFLSTISKDWRDRVGVGTSVNWPVGVEAEGNGGVAKEVRANPYSLGYIELSYAITDKLAYGMVLNRAGKFVDPTLESVTAAAASAEAPADLRFSIVNAPGERSYPIVTGTWLIVYKTQTDPAKAQAIARYLWWTTHDGQSINTTLNYAPVPREITVRSEELVKQINVGGKPALPR